MAVPCLKMVPNARWAAVFISAQCMLGAHESKRKAAARLTRDATVREVPPSEDPSTEPEPEIDNTFDTSEIKAAFQQLRIGVTIRRGRIDRSTGRKEILIVGTGQQLEAASAYCRAQQPPIEILYNRLPS